MIDWKQAVIDEGMVDLIKEYDNGWHIFQNKTGRHYSGILYFSVEEFFAICKPQLMVDFMLKVRAHREYKDNNFTDGRQLRRLVKMVDPKELNSTILGQVRKAAGINDEDWVAIDRAFQKIKPLGKSGSPEHKAALKVARKNRQAAVKMWGQDVVRYKPPLMECIKPEKPEELVKTLILLNQKKKRP